MLSAKKPVAEEKYCMVYLHVVSKIVQLIGAEI
jgi:hypothetical protein